MNVQGFSEEWKQLSIDLILAFDNAVIDGTVPEDVKDRLKVLRDRCANLMLRQAAAKYRPVYTELSLTDAEFDAYIAAREPHLTATDFEAFQVPR